MVRGDKKPVKVTPPVEPVTSGPDTLKPAEPEQSTTEGGKAEVVLAAPYAYYDADGVLNSWHPGQKVTDPTIIAVLIARGAPLKG